MAAQSKIRAFAQEWFDQLSDHVAVDEIIVKLVDGGLEMKFPESTLLSHADFRDWYRVVGDAFTNQVHVIEQFDTQDADGGIQVSVQVVWEADQTSGDPRLEMRAQQTWFLTMNEAGEPQIVKYSVDSIEDIS